MSTTGTHDSTIEGPAPAWVWPAIVVAAVALTNAVPHTLAGPLVLNLPTPFSGGPGTLSGPMINFLWGLSNIALGVILLSPVRPWLHRRAVRVVLIVAAVAFATFLTWAIGSLPLPGRFA